MKMADSGPWQHMAGRKVLAIRKQS